MSERRRKMIKKRLLAVLLVFIAAVIFINIASADDSQIVIPITYEKYPDQINFFKLYGYSSVMFKPDAVPDSDLKLPKMVSKKILVSKVKIGDIEYNFILDRKKKGDDFYNIIYFDSNNNKDLSDDSPMEGITRWYGDENCNVDFKALDFKIKIGDKEYPYSLKAQVYSWGIKKGGEVPDQDSRFGMMNNINLNFRLNCCYKGSFELNNIKYIINIADSNVNGSFNQKVNIMSNDANNFEGEYTPLYPQGDSMIISATENLNYYDQIYISDYLYLNSILYSVEVKIEEGKIILTPCNKDLADITLPDVQIDKLVLLSEDNSKSVVYLNAPKNVKIPTGKYRVITYKITKQGKEGDTWILAANSTKKTPFFEIDGTSQASVSFGEPFRPNVYVPEWAIQNLRSGVKDVQLSFGVIGSSNESVNVLSKVSGNKSDVELSKQYKDRPLEPKFKIIKSDGSIVKEDSFKYG